VFEREYRYDMLCFEGIAQALAIFQGKREIPKYKLSHPEKIETLTIKPEVLSHCKIFD
jgi:phenylalanyl-tRNA synthetase beta chain